MKKKEWACLIFLAMVTAAALLIGIGQIYVIGVDGERLWEPESVGLLLETAVLFGVFFLILKRCRVPAVRWCLLFLAGAVFSWLHRAFFPLLVSGLYVLLLLRLGSTLRRQITGGAAKKGENGFLEFHEITAMADFVLGSSLMILAFCLLSLAGIGSIAHTRILTALLAAVYLVPAASRMAARLSVNSSWRKRFLVKKRPMSFTAAVMVSVMLAILFMQAGRMNICLDYDSLHYGLRSEYVLNNGNGIYENLGSVNVVYTYPKGLEILLLPLSGLPSYGFFLAFQVWAAAGVLFSCGKIAELFVSRRYSLLCAAMVSCIPGVMNMAISAKTDMVTVLYQLIMICFLLLYLKKRRDSYLVIALDAFLLTLVMKPTALVFSTAVFGTAILYMLITKNLRFRFRESLWQTVIPTAAMWLLVWLRTFLLTGVPITSVFYEIWEKLGFYAKYPFWFAALPSNGGSPFSKEGVWHFVRRLYGVLLAPVSEDMAHVRIAWGSPFLVMILALFLVPAIVRMKKGKKREKAPLSCLLFLFLSVGAASLAALYLLWQVDGNYFMLLYCLFAVLAVIVIGKMENAVLAHLTVELFVPAALFNMTIMAVSNWAGVLGLTPVSVFHAGYYDHAAENEAMLKADGNREIWDILAADEETRALVIGSQPEMLLFPCNAQSSTDIEGSDGNLYLAASPEALVCYLNYAGTDYIYLGSGYLKPGTDGWNNVVVMLKKGYMTDMLYENGNALGRFDAEPAPPENADAVLKEFSTKYWAGEQQ